MFQMDINAEFNELANLHRDRVFTFSCYWLQNREDAEDVTQEILVRMWRCRNAVPADRMGVWLMRVTRNACIDLARRRKTRQHLNSGTEPDTAFAITPDPAPIASDALQSEETVSCVKNIVAQLDEPQKSIVLLRDVHDMSYAEIASVLSLTLDQVRVYLHRGRQKVRKCLQERVSHGEL